MLNDLCRSHIWRLSILDVLGVFTQSLAQPDSSDSFDFALGRGLAG